MTTRAAYATAREADVDVLRRAFESGGELARDTAHLSLGVPERRFRAAVAALRAEGYPVISASEQGSRYRKAKDIAELDAFIDGELLPRIRKLEREARAMRTFGRDHYRTTQPTLL